MRRLPLGTFRELGISAARDAARTLHTKVKNEGRFGLRIARAAGGA
ncbi:MAG: hypothetical protein JWQ55_5876 [Rhodopila sp.]|jgi:hypothetical protein|nr:hypothetical protein [Rhodopila sp.]